MSLAALVIAVVVSQREPRLQVGVQGGYVQHLPPEPIDPGFSAGPEPKPRSGFELGVDGRYRFFGPLSAGVFVTHGFISRGEVIRAGGLIGIDSLVGPVRLSADLGVGYRRDTGAGNGLVGQVDLAALWAVDHKLGIGAYGSAVITNDFGSHSLYAWFSGGFRGTANFL